jgi:transcriptional regulator with PAS, ATPase and Fis domain
MRRSVLSADGDIIKPEGIEFLSAGGKSVVETLALQELPNVSLSEIEKLVIQRTLKSMKGNKKKTASILQIDYSTLIRKIKQYSIT